MTDLTTFARSLFTLANSNPDTWYASYQLGSVTVFVVSGGLALLCALVKGRAG